MSNESDNLKVCMGVLLNLMFSLLPKVLAFTCQAQECDGFSVPIKQLGDGLCDVGCMSQSCGYDRAYGASAKSDSDCFAACLSKGCDPILMGNGVCDLSCSSAECGWDWGDCGSCHQGCKSYAGFPESLGNGKCEEACDLRSCGFDGGDCGDCASGCLFNMINDTICQPACYVPECSFDGNDCNALHCTLGCLPGMVGDGVCQETCHVEACDWDKTDCDCSPGCIPELLNNYVCDAVCNFEMCQFDNHECARVMLGDCAVGCSASMVGNGQCDSVCNSIECSWDGLDCDCAPGCNVADYGTCKDACMNPNCGYDSMPGHPSCSSVQVQMANRVLQLFTKSFTSVYSYQDMCVISTPACGYSTWMNSYYTCASECADSNLCISSFGTCSANCDSVPNCQICHISDCYKCKAGFFSFYLECVSACPVSYSPHPLVPDLCYYTPDVSTESYPTLYYVSTATNTLNLGTSTDPFQSLCHAFAVAHTRFVRIYLLSGTYKLTTGERSPYLHNPADAAIFQGTEYDFEPNIEVLPLLCTTLNIMGCVLSNAPVLLLDNLNPAIIGIRGTVTFEGIVFNGLTPMVTGCLTDLCTYCPLVLNNEGMLLDDRLKILSAGSYTPQSICDTFHSQAFITLEQNATLILQNVTFVNFKEEFSSLIFMVNGRLTLTNVVFQNITVYQSVILQTGADLSTELWINGGLVEQLNNGYEYQANTAYAGFLLSKRVRIIVIESVNFQYNLLGLAGNLIDLGNFLTVQIQNCQFAYNLGRLVSVTSTVILPLDMDATNTALIYYSLTHLSIFNSTFSGNSGKSLVSVSLSGDVLNMEMRNCTFTNCLSTSSGLVHFLSTRPPNIQEISGSGLFPKMWTEISASTFTHCSVYGDALISVQSLPNVGIQGVLISESGDLGPQQQIYTVTLQAMMEFPRMYMSQPVTDLKVLNCRSLIDLQAIYNLNITESTFTTNICMAGSVGIVGLSLYEKTLFSALDFTSNRAQSSVFGTVMDISISGTATLQGLSVMGNKNTASSGTGIVKLTSSNVPILLSDSSFSGNLSPGGGTLYCLGSFDIRTSKFAANVSSGSTAAGIVYSPLSTALQFTLTSSTFANNYSIFNGAITITEMLPASVPIQLTILSCIFDSNESKTDGSCLYITSAATLSSSSLISQSAFINNKAYNACIVNNFISGVLVIDESVFRNNTAEQYAVLFATHVASTLQIASIVILQNTLIEWNFGLYIVGFDNPNTMTQGASANLTFQHNNGRGFYLQITFWNDYGSVFRNNTAIDSGAVIYGLCLNASFQNTIFEGNVALQSGGAIYVNMLSEITIKNCAFVENSSMGMAGAVMMSQQSIMTISDCIFRGNTAQAEGSAVYLFPAILIRTSIIVNTTFTENESAGGAITVVGCDLSMIGCSIYGNKGTDSPGLLIYLSRVRVTNSSFWNQTAKKGAFISVAAASNVTVNNTHFLNGEVSDSGAGIYAIASYLGITQSTFSNLNASTGAAIALLTGFSLEISGCDFTNITATQMSGGVISISESRGSISESVFHSFSNGAIVGDNSSIAITESLFYRKCYADGNNDKGAALSCTECSSVNIQHTVCRGLKADSAACFFLEVINIPVLYTLNNCSVESTTSQTMGAVVLSNVNAQILGSRFINNSAIGSIDDGDGGGLYLSPCLHTSGCQINISDSQFINNTASHQGGAIAWTDYKPVLTNVSFADNFAPYGNDIASYAIKLAPLTLRRLYQLPGVPSGQVAPESVTVALFDHYDQIVTIDDYSLANLFSVLSSTSVSGVTQVIAEKGIFVFSAYEVISTPGNTTEIKVHTNGIDIYKPLNNGTISSELVISVQVRNCTIGESQLDDKCYVCPAGKYSLDPSTACQDCPIGAICLGNSTMIPESGYWRSSYMSATFWACPNAGACLRSSTNPNNISYTGNCETGYYGNMCNGCISGYSLTSTNSCTQCPSFASSIAEVVGIAIFIILVILFVIKMSLVSAKKDDLESSISLKIFINYIQLVALVSSLNLSWPSNVSQFLNSQENAGSVSEQLFSFDCLVDNGTQSNQQHIVYQKIIILACLPLMIVITSLCFWLLVSVFSGKWRYMKYQFVNSLTVMFFIAHPSIVKVMFSVFNCQQIDPGQYWMTSYLNIRCWDSEHMKYAMIVALPSIILWGLLVPAITLLLLVLNRKHLNELSLRIQLGFVFTGYQDHKCFWEFVILYRKVMFITFAVFLTSVSIQVQALCSMLGLFVTFLLQVKHNPYSTALLNNLELRGILAAGVTIYCGLFYLTADLSNDAKDVLFAIIVSANAYFVLLFLFHQCKALCQFLGKLIKRTKPSHYNIAVQPDENSQALSRLYSNSEIELFDGQTVQKQRRIVAPQNTPKDSLVIT